MPPARKYLPLNRFLEQLEASQQTVLLPLTEIERILGSALPPSAWLAHYWAGSSVARYNWERSGFGAKLDRLGRQIIFTRRARRVL